MCRGCSSSCRYSASCLSESWRPNQMFHQNRNGIRTISHAVMKKSSRLPVDMRGRGLGGGLGVLLASEEDCEVAPGRTGMGSRKYSRKRVSGLWVGKVGRGEHHYRRVLNRRERGELIAEVERVIFSRSCRRGGLEDFPKRYSTTSASSTRSCSR